MTQSRSKQKKSKYKIKQMVKINGHNKGPIEDTKSLIEINKYIKVQQKMTQRRSQQKKSKYKITQKVKRNGHNKGPIEKDTRSLTL